MKTLTNSILLLLISSLLLFSCKKEEQPTVDSTKPAKIKVQVNINDFANDLLTGKFASTYSYDPDQVTSVEFNNEYMIDAVLSPIDNNNSPIGSKLLKSNSKLASTDLESGIAYVLLVYNSSGKIVDYFEYIPTQEAREFDLFLTKGEEFNFISYAISNNTRKEHLSPLLYVNEDSDPSYTALLATSTLSNTTIRQSGNDDLLLFRKKVTIPNQETYDLSINLNHMLNLLQTTIDVSDTGYSIGE